MPKVQNINPERIYWCCEQFDISPEILSIQLRIPLESLKKTLVGEEGITINQLRKISSYFHRGLLFFLESSPVNEEIIYTPQFRTLTGQKPSLSPDLRALIERIEKQRKIYINLLDELDSDKSEDWRVLNLPSNSIQDIKRGAKKARKWLGLNDRETFDGYRQKIESKGVFVIVTNGYVGQWQIAKEDTIRGFSLYYPKYPVIVVKKQYSIKPQAFTLMHELGHLLLHKDGYIDDENDFRSNQGKEKTANEFAGNILVPDKFLARINLIEFPFDEVGSYDSYLSTYSSRWSVSTEVILRRMLNEGILDSSQYEGFRTWRMNLPPPTPSEGGNRSGRFKEPLKIFGDSFVNTVLTAYHENRITINKTSSYLDNIKIADIHKLEMNS